MVFSFMALILRSEDCRTFMPLPLWPMTTNLGILKPLRPISTPALKIMNNTLGRKTRKGKRRREEEEAVRTVGEAGGAEGERGVLGDVVKGRDVGDMDGLESHLGGRREREEEREREVAVRKVPDGLLVVVVKNNAWFGALFIASTYAKFTLRWISPRIFPSHLICFGYSLPPLSFYTLSISTYTFLFLNLFLFNHC